MAERRTTGYWHAQATVFDKRRRNAQSTDERIRASNILVVEDDPVSRTIMIESLHNHGFQDLHHAADGATALAFIASQTPDLIILDLLMPDMDGFELCRLIKAMPKFRNVPILVYTALENEQQRLSIFAMGASDLALKPINPEELISRCWIHLEKRYILKDLHDYRTRMEEDLSHAREMQNQLMPDKAMISQNERDFGLDIKSLFAPSVTIGGDFWGMRRLPTPGKLAVYIGDFTGHGVTAAINVFRLVTLMGRLPEEVLESPSATLSQLNQQLHAVLPIELFATMFYGVLDTNDDTLTYSAAGCPAPLLLRRDMAQTSYALDGSGLPLAAIRNPHYADYSTRFYRGDAIVLYSDALIETPNSRDEYLEPEVITKSLTAIPPQERNADNLLNALVDQFNRFIGERPVEDDMTLNVYRRL